MKKTFPAQLLKIPFTTSQAVSCGLSKSYLTRMVRSGVLQRLSWGVYQASGEGVGTGEELYRVATLRCGVPSAICLLSALEHYHLTDQIPKKIWILVPEPKRIVSTDLRLVRSRDPKWDIGIAKTEHYWVTTLERTLVEGLLFKRLIGGQVALEAIKRAVKQKKTRLGNLYDMAKRMGAEHRIRPYIEALAS
jgi:predicted transcriptional regulator of viral defense system